jgi:hypothetical protein
VPPVASPYTPGTDTSPAVVEQKPGIDLRDPILAACLAWLIPGAGHFYQRRWGKGGLFMVCILGTFFMGMWMGEGRVVYASWRHNDQRYAYFCQLGVGLPSLPAVVQAIRINSDPPRAPLFNGLMAPPLMPGQMVPTNWALAQVARGELQRDDFPDLAEQAPPAYVCYLYSTVTHEYSRKIGSSPSDPFNQLSDWNFRMGPYFELGTVYTLIAGLLNILAIYDAWGGPVAALTGPESESADDRKKNG